MFKQQVQETSGFLKKQQQALAEKVQKGLNMTSSIMSGQKKDVSSKTTDLNHDFTPPARPSQAHATVGALNPAWITALEQMGFQAAKIEEAAALLGGKPQQMDDLLQVLVTMNESSASGGTAAREPVANPSPVSSLPTDSKQVESRSTTTRPPPLATTTMPQQSLPPPVSPTHSPGLASKSAVGSEEYEMAVDKHKLIHTAPKFTQHKTLTPSAFMSLQQMGFTADAIHQASGRMRPNSTYEELFDLLLAMGSPLSPPNSGTAASSTDGASAAACAAYQEVKVNQDAAAETEVEPTNREIAASVVSFVLAKVAAKSASSPKWTKEAKHVVEGPFTASPMRGGA